MSDKERILTNLVRGLATAQVLGAVNAPPYGPERYRRIGGDGFYVHLAHYRLPVVGDLVLCDTSATHPWSIGWYVGHEFDGSGSAVIREIGSGRLCNMRNESFVPVVGMRPLELLEGARYRFLQKVYGAFSRGGEWLYRFGGLDFPEDGIGRIWIREVVGGSLGPNGESVPFSVDVVFTARTSIKAILSAMRGAGYGTRMFERREVTKEARDGD
jgi:hypothetical protein